MEDINSEKKLFFNFDKYGDTLIDLLKDNIFETPLNIGIFGRWGEGKSTLMKYIMEKLDKENSGNDKYKIIGFNAWEFQYEENIWAALAFRNLNEIRSKENEESIDKIQNTIIQKSIIFGKGTLNYFFDETKIGQNVKKLKEEIHTVSKKEENNNSHDIEKIISKIYQQYINDATKLKEAIESLIAKLGFKLAIFIDDIDRIGEPDKAIEILEGLHLVLSVKNTVFFLALSDEIIKYGIANRISKYNIKNNDDLIKIFKSVELELIDNYLEKIIQIPFQLPKLRYNDIFEFSKHLFGTELPNLAIIISGFEFNPRWIIKCYNTFNILYKLY